MGISRRRFLTVPGAFGALFAGGCERSAQPANTASSREAEAEPPVSRPGFYSTRFPYNEMPISENGHWLNNGQLWTKVQTIRGCAYGTNGARNTYDDSYAYLSGTFGADQQGEATIFRSATLRGDPHECEILLRWADGSTLARGYECLFNFAGGVQITRWNGAFGDFTELQGGDGSYRRGLATGDVVKAKIVGDAITCYINGERVAQVHDTVWTDGQPGIGFFKRLPGLNTDLGFSSFTASAL